MQKVRRDAHNKQSVSKIKTKAMLQEKRRIAFVFISVLTRVKSIISTLLHKVVTALAITTLFVPGSVLIFGLNNKAIAAESSYINFQARILQASGALVPDGTYHVEFKLYYVSSAGTALWTETRDKTTTTASEQAVVKNGYISVRLGAVTAFPSTINWDQELYLGMNIGGTATTPAWDGEMSPRFIMTSVPYSKQSKTSLGVTSNNTSSASTNSSAVSISTGNASGATSNSGNITIDSGTATGTTGTISIAGTNASGLTLARSGLQTTIAGNALVQGGTLTVGTTSQAGSLVISDGSSNTVTLTSSGVTADYSLTLPTAAGTTDQCLRTSPSVASQLVFGSCGTTGAVTSVGGIDTQTKSANGAVIASGVLYMQTADATNVGLVSTGTQTFAGNKTFTGNTAFNGTVTVGAGAVNGSITLFSTGTTAPTLTADASGNLNINAGNGTVVVGKGSGGIDLQLTNVNDVLTGSKTFTAATGYSSNDFSYIRTVTGGANALSGSVFYINDTSTTSSTNTANVLNINTVSGTGNLILATTGSVTPTTRFQVTTAGNTTVGGTLGVTGAITASSTALFKPSSDSVTALQIQPSASTTPVLNVDTTNSRVGIGTNAPQATFDIQSSSPIMHLRNTSGTGVGTAANIKFYGNDTNQRGQLDFTIETGGASSLTFSNGVGSMAQMFKVDGNSSSRGQVTVVGGLSTDLTTLVSSGTAASFTLQPGLSTGASSNGAATTIKGGNGSGTTSVTGGLLTLQGGSATGASGTRNGGSVTIDAGTGATANGSISIGTTSAASILLGRSGITTTNGGATLNSTLGINDLATGGAIGTAAATVDSYTSATLNQTTSGQSITIPSPTITTAGRMFYLTNIGAQSVTFTNTYLNSTLSTNTTASLMWTGSAWVFAGADGNGILNQNTADQTANFRISGTGRANNSLQTPLLDQVSASALNIGTNNATQINLNKNTVITGTGTIKASSASAFTVQNSAGTATLLAADTSTATGSLKVFDLSGGANFASISYNNSSSTAVFAASTGTTQIGGGTGGNIQLTLSQSADQLLATKSVAPSVAYSLSDYNFTRNLTGTSNALSGSVFYINDTSTTSSTNTANVLNINTVSGTGNLILATTGSVTPTTRFQVTTAGNTTVGGTLGVTGAATLSSTLVVTGNVTANANLTVGSGAGVGLFTNNGATRNVTADAGNFTTDNNINAGTTANAVNLYTSISVPQTTAGRSISISIPSASTDYGRTVYVGNTGTASLTLYNSFNITGTTTGTGASTTSLTLTADVFNVNDYIYIDNAGTDFFTQITADPANGSYTVSPAVTFETSRTVTKQGSPIVLNAGTTTTLVWSNTSGGASWQYSGADGSGILNQNSITQTANFQISGTGRANTSFTSPVFDSTSGALSVGTSNATGVTIGGTTNTTGITLQGASNATYAIGTANGTGTITLGQSTTATSTLDIQSANATASTQTINIGGGTSATSGGKTVNIANGVPGLGTVNLVNIGTGGSTAGTVGITIGSATAANHTVLIQGGNVNTAGSEAIRIQTSAAGGIAIGTAAQTGTITLGQSTAGQTISIGNAVNTGAQTLNIANGASGANSTVNILSGVGTAGTGTLLLGNNTRVTLIDIGNVAAAAARTINLGSGANTVGVDTINIGTGPTLVAGGKTINIGNGTPSGSGTNIITIGSIAALANTTTIQGGNGSTAIQLQTAASGTVSIGTTSQSGTVSIGSTALSTGTQAINLGFTSTSGGTTNVNIGSGTAATAGTTTIQGKTAVNITAFGASTWSTSSGQLTVQSGSGTLSLGSTTTLTASGALTVSSGGSNALTLDPVGPAAVNVGTASATSVSISRIGQTTTVNGSLTLGSAGVGLLTNNGSTKNTTFDLTNFTADNNINASTANAVSIYTSLAVPQTTAGRSISVSRPSTLTDYGRTIYISNTGTASFNLYNSYNVSGTTSVGGSTTTTLTMPTDIFNANDYVYIDNSGTDFFTQIITDFGTGSYTVSPAITYDNGATVIKQSAPITLNSGTTTTLVWANATSGGASWQFAGSDGSGILNQNAIDQSANFRISGSGTISSNSLTTNSALNISSSSSAITSGSLLKVNYTSTGALTSGIVSLSATGAYTSSSNAGLLNVSANGTTAGTVANFGSTTVTTGAVTNFSGAAVTSGNVVQIAGNTSNTLTTGASLKVNGGRVSLTPTMAVATSAGAVWNGIDVTATTVTLTGSTSITTATGFNLFNLSAPTITNNSSTTITNAATAYIGGAPLQGGSVSITNPYALWVDSGNVRFDGALILNQSSTGFNTTIQPSSSALAASIVFTLPSTVGSANQCLQNSATPGTLTFAACSLAALTDNVVNAFDLQEGTNDYININTTNGSENISLGNTVTNPSYSFLGTGNITLGGNLLSANSATANTGTTSGTGTNTTTLTLSAIVAGFANNDIIFIDNAGQDYYTRIVSGAGTATLTVSPAVTFETARTVTEYQNVRNIGATATDYTLQTQRFFQGYFLGGVVTGAGSTILSDGLLTSTGGLTLQTSSTINALSVTSAGAATFGGTLAVTTSVSAPIFYDSDNSAFYVNPAGTTNLSGLTLGTVLSVANGGTGASTSTGSGAVVLQSSPTLSGTPTANSGEFYVSNGFASTRVHNNGTNVYIDANQSASGVTADIYLRPIDSSNVRGSIRFTSSDMYATSAVLTNVIANSIFRSTATTFAAGSVCRSVANAFGWFEYGNCSSLAKYKDEVQNLPYGLETIRQLRPVQYKWNIDSMDYDTGFIAEEVNAIAPIFNEYTDGKISGVKYDHMVSLAINGVKILDSQVQDIDGRLAVVESGILPELHVTGDAEIGGSLTVTGDTYVQNITVNGKIITAGNAPSIALGAEAKGVNASATVTGNDIAGSVSYEPGAKNLPNNTVTSGEQIVITFDKPYTATPRVTMTPTNDKAASIRYYVEKDLTSLKIKFIDTPEESATYTFDYQIIQ